MFANLTRTNALLSSKWALNKGNTQTISPNIFYYFIFPLMERYQKKIYKNLDYYIDIKKNNSLLILSKRLLEKIIDSISQQPIKLKPIYEPGVWGGQWLVKNRKLKLKNCAIGIELISQEQSILVKVKEFVLELPFNLLMNLKGEKILGEKNVKKYNNYFPVRIAYDDTFRNKGDNLSIQIHPNKSYMSKNFNEPLGQAEMYYITDTLPNSKIYLGFKEKINSEKFINDVIFSSKFNKKIDYEKYINIEFSKKGNLYLIPPGTVHASGSNNFVLEISNTPYRYTFKIYDYCRKNLDGKNRKLSINHAFNVLKFNRKRSWIKKNCCPKPKLIKNLHNSKEFLLSNNSNFTFNVHRVHFSKYYFDKPKDSMHILNLVEGTRVKLVSIKNNFVSYLGHSETLLIPKCFGKYKILNLNTDACKMIKVLLK